MRKIVQYLKMDMYRSFINIKFFVAIIAISFLPFIARAEQQGYSFTNIFSENSIFQFLGEVSYWSEIGILNFIIIAFVYSDCFCDDLSEGNYIYTITRGNVNGYLISKVISVFVNSIITYIVGMFLFAGLSSIFFGFKWEIEGGELANEYLYSNFNTDAFSGIIENRYYFLFFLCCIGLQSLLYGITTLGSLLTSLYIKNKLLTLCVPTLLISVGNYALSYIVPDYSGYKNIYSVDFFYMRNTTEALTILLVGTFIIIILFFILMKRQLRRIVIE